MISIMVLEGNRHHSAKAPFSHVNAILCILIALALAGLAIFFFVVLPQRQTTDSTAADDNSTYDAPYEELELATIELYKQVESNYKKGDYSVTEPLLEAAMAKYPQSGDKIKVASGAESILIRKEDWVQLVKYYERMTAICPSTEFCDNEDIDYFAEHLAEARAYE